MCNRPCGMTHEELYELVNIIYVVLTIRFTLKAFEPDDERTKAVLYLLY
mgnify:CR=1 FL=1